MEIVGDKGVIKEDDYLAGNGKKGNFSYMFGNLIGSKSYSLSDKLGKEEIIDVEACD